MPCPGVCSLRECRASREYYTILSGDYTYFYCDAIIFEISREYILTKRSYFFLPPRKGGRVGAARPSRGAAQRNSAREMVPTPPLPDPGTRQITSGRSPARHSDGGASALPASDGPSPVKEPPSPLHEPPPPFMARCSPCPPCYPACLMNLTIIFPPFVLLVPPALHLRPRVRVQSLGFGPGTRHTCTLG